MQGAAMLLAQAFVLHRLAALRRQRRPATLPADPSVGNSAAGAAALAEPSLVNLASLDCRHPQRFYLPGNAAAMELLSDCFALVDGVRLPLHGQLLAAQAAVLRDMFVALARPGRDDGGASDEGAGDAARLLPPFELSSAFAGCSLRQVSVFLRFIYCPDHATPGSLHGVHAAAGGLLAAVAGLAHRLDAGGLLAKIEGYLQAASASASIADLLSTVQLAEACHLGGLADTCLTLLARRLAAAGPFWPEQVRREQLAACSSDSLASLACKMAGTVSAGAFEPPTVHGVLPGHGGAAGGFTWVIERFSKQQGRVTSPWVEVGGVQWRLKVWPRGDDAAGGTHLSAYLECNHAQQAALGLAAIEAYYDFDFLDTSEDGLHFHVDCGKDVFTATTQNWGKTRMMPLGEMARPDRRYLDKDRLAVRISIRVLPPASAGLASASAPGAAAPVPQLAPPLALPLLPLPAAPAAALQ